MHADGLRLNRRQFQVLSALCRQQALYSTTKKKERKKEQTNGKQNKTTRKTEEERNLTQGV